MGKKDPQKGGVYSNSWHIPGGGVAEGESLSETAIRETKEETGIVITEKELLKIHEIGEGISEKVLKETGERVLCRMSFNRFEVRLDENSQDVFLHNGDDLIDLQWFDQIQLGEIDHISGGKEFFMRMGYIK